MTKNQTISFLLLLFVIGFSCTGKSGETTQTELDSVEQTTDTVVDEDTMQGDIEDQLFDRSEREKWQNPTLVLRKLGDVDNKVIADIGSGTGYFTFPLALRAKKVIAIDIDAKFLDYIEEQKVDYPPKIANTIETRLTEEDSPNLQTGEINIAFMVNVYSYLQNRVSYLEKIKSGLKKDGFILIVDFKKGDLPIGPSDNFKVAPETVKAELTDAGFNDINIDVSSLEYQYIVKARI